MHVVHTLADLRRALPQRSGCSFIPTMGNLHAGHLALVQLARQRDQPVVTSIFVNRLQFLPHEDFDRYPRTLAQDCAQLAQAGCDLVFAPNEHELYPQTQEFKVQPPPSLADILEGAFRPGFFTGVCTVVMKLFACIQPSMAVFGQKDYQQFMIIQAMVRQLNLPIELIGAPTQRAPDGLALSSRNQYLDASQRQEAPQLYAALQHLGAAVRHTQDSLEALEAQAHAYLTARGWRPDYLTVRRRVDLKKPDLNDLGTTPLVALGAAWLGSTRLIDNVEC